jgi:hypothetical protein
MIDYAVLRGGRMKGVGLSDISSCSSEDIAGGESVQCEQRSLRAELYGSSSNSRKSE